MKKTAIILALMLITISMSLSVSALNRTIPVSTKVNIDFTGTYSFVLLMQNGLEKHYTWNATTIPADDSFTHTVYANLDPEDWCGDNTALYQYQDMSKKFANMTSLCLDSSTQYAKTVKALSDNAELSTKIAACGVDLNKTNRMLSDLQSKERQFDSTINDFVTCQGNYAACKADQDKLATCTQDLKKANEDKNMYGIFGIVIGLGVGWYLWKREKKPQVTGPAEQGNNIGGDFVNIDPRSIPKRGSNVNRNVWDKFDKSPREDDGAHFPGDGGMN